MAENDLNLPADRTDVSIAVGSALISAVPWLGGPVSNVLTGYGQRRKFDRVKDVLDGLADELRNFESDVAKDYVRTEDFEDLLEQTLRRAADDRHAEVRELYRRFLRQAIVQPGDEYDEQLNVLRVLERLRSQHIAIMKALRQEPSPDAHKKFGGSPIQTLHQRTGLERAAIKTAVREMNDLRVTNLEGLNVMMTGRGSETLQHGLTDLGKKVLDYVATR